ncbi:MAG TPA: GNAT family N-acetyltransferase [Bellilinea sp.]|nr:GNAT family N-acetyltransferase [Bellilinea sp.]
MKDGQSAFQSSPSQNAGDAAPPPLTIRPAVVADAAAMARVHVDTWRTTYPGIIADSHLARLSYERSEKMWIEHLTNPGAERAFVAVTPAGEVVGLASGGPIREPLEQWNAELVVIYIRQAYQGSGCGRRLVTTVAQDLASRGFQSLVIWVMKDNQSARGFYEKLGGRLTAEKPIRIGEEDLLEVAYVWPELKVFG